MYILRSKKTGIDCGWGQGLWKTGGFEIVDDESGLPTPAKVIAGIQKVTGLDLTTSAPTPVMTPPNPLLQPEPIGILTPAVPAVPPVAPPVVPETTVTDAADPANVTPTDVFAGAVNTDAEVNS